MAPTEKERRQRRASGGISNVPSAASPEMLETESEIDFIELFYRLMDNVRYIILAALLFALIAGVYTFAFQTPLYKATSKLYVMSPSDSAINLADLQISTYLKNDYQEIFNTWEIHEMVIKNLGLPYSYSRMQSMVSISNPKDTRILYITVTSDNPAEATAVANEYASVAKKYISATMATDEPNVLSVALQPTRPVSPNKTKNILFGFILGALAAMAIIVIRFIVDDKIKTADDIAKYADLPTLAIVPIYNESDNGGSAKKQGRWVAKKKVMR